MLGLAVFFASYCNFNLQYQPKRNNFSFHQIHLLNLIVGVNYTEQALDRSLSYNYVYKRDICRFALFFRACIDINPGNCTKASHEKVHSKRSGNIN